MRRRVIRAALYIAVIALTMSVVYVATRGRAASAASTTATRHNHAAPTSVGDAAKPVTLSDANARRIGVTFATATLGSLGTEVRTLGQITFDETRLTTIAPKIDGWVEQLFVNATGQPVSAGQPLLTIYSPMLVSAQEELLLAKRLQRDVSVADSTTRQRAADLLASARQRLAYWDISERDIAEIERTGEVRKTLTLRATSGGYVLEKNVLAGQKIMAGDALYKVVDLSTVWVEGEVFEQDLSRIRVGESVHAEFQAAPGEPRTGRVAYIYPTLNAETRTARIRVVLSNTNLRLKPGMYATIRIAGTERANVVTVPRSAVLSTGERSIVFVRDANGRLAPREVALGASNDERVEIVRGISVGETVVSSATFLVDAESNLGTALGGMGNMPGMDLTIPPKPLGEKKSSAPKTP
jgi:membrane fusion protein, copper/silver efflux system